MTTLKERVDYTVGGLVIGFVLQFFFTIAGSVYTGTFLGGMWTGLPFPLIGWSGGWLIWALGYGWFEAGAVTERRADDRERRAKALRRELAAQREIEALTEEVKASCERSAQNAEALR